MQRRTFLTTGCAALWPGSSAVAAVDPRRRDRLLTDPVLTHVRMRAHPDGRPCYVWYQGTFYGQLAGQRTQALLHIEGASTSRTTRNSDGRWSYAMREAGWFCDLQTRQVVDEWRNPLNDRNVRPQHYNSSQQLWFEPSGQVTPGVSVLPPGLEFQGRLTEPVIEGGDVWSAEELLVRVPPAREGEMARVQTSLATLHATLADLMQPESRWVPATLAYQTLGSWQAWLEMGTATGVVSWRLFGRKCARRENIPAHIRTRIERQHPEVFA